MHVFSWMAIFTMFTSHRDNNQLISNYSVWLKLTKNIPSGSIRCRRDNIVMSLDLEHLIDCLDKRVQTAEFNWFLKTGSASLKLCVLINPSTRGVLRLS